MSHNTLHFMDIFYLQNTMKISLCNAVVHALNPFHILVQTQNLQTLAF